MLADFSDLNKLRKEIHKRDKRIRQLEVELKKTMEIIIIMPCSCTAGQILSGHHVDCWKNSIDGRRMNPAHLSRQRRGRE